MMLHAMHFGAIPVDELATIEFPEGLPGFESCRRFVPLESAGGPGLIFLQSLEQPQLCFITLPLRSLWPDYELAISAEERDLLGLDPDQTPGPRDLILLAILSFTEGQDPTANLLAPVVIHAGTRRAVQVVRQDGRYPIQAPLPVGEMSCS
ncbi:MAG TPA: flagellar assembly protein FliW [Bryobacteraceae bacterium]|nr:flagellar assembly protein FliW [Bryobacteraceae bacterium]